MIWWTLLASASAASAEDLRSVIADFNRKAVFKLPTLSDTQLAQLSRGEPVALLIRGESEAAWRAVGLIVAQAPQQDVWISCQDTHFVNAERVTELRLAGGANTDRASWYGHIDLPMPASDRHWVVDVWNNHALSQSSGGQMWEHPWRVDPDGVERTRPHVEKGEVSGLTIDAFDASIYTPVNEGAWVAIALSEDETLLSYNSATDIGGFIPPKLVAQFSVSGMRSVITRVATRAATDIHSHYRSGHEPIFGGDGTILPTYP